MNTQALALQMLTVVACAAIFFKVEPVLNRMQKLCRVSLRFAFALLAVGSAGMILVITQGYVPSAWVTLQTAGTAILLIGDRRATNP